MGCGACCRQAGYVRLKQEELDQIATFVEMDILTFTDKFTVLTSDRQTLSLKDKPYGECIFLYSKGCRINPVEPWQCKSFPHKWKFKKFNKICAWAKKANARNPEIRLKQSKILNHQ